MQNPVRILALSGSTRRDSFNQSLVTIAALGALEADAEVITVQLRDFEMPLFNEDLERDQGLPEGARRLRELLINADGLLLASPEYNGSFTAVLKNALDWLSRPQGDGFSAFHGKVAAIMAASPGGLGGLRALPHVRTVLTNLGVMVIPEQFALPAAHRAFDDEGALVNADQSATVKALSARVVDVARRMKYQVA